MRNSKIARFVIASVLAFTFLAEMAIAFIWWEFKFNINQELNVVDLNGGEAVRPGEKLEYEISFGNYGLIDINDLKIEVSIPDKTKVVAVGYDGDHDIRGNKVILSVGSPERGTEGKADLIVEVESPLDRGILISPLYVRYSFRKINRLYTVLKDSGISRKVESSPRFDQSVVAAFDDNRGELNVRDMLRYEIVLKNTGDMNAKDLHIEKLIPENTIPQRVNLVERSNSFYLNGFDSVDIENFIVGEELTLDIDVRVKEGIADKTEIVFSPVLNYGSEEVEFSEIRRVVRVYPKLENYALKLIDVNGGATAPGDTLKVSVHIENNGDTAATGLKFTIDIPKQCALSPPEGTVNPGLEVDGNKLVWIIGELGINEKSDQEFFLEINKGIGYGENISTAGFISYNELEDIKLTSNAIRTISPFAYTIVGLGDSQMAKTSWLSNLDAMLEAAFPMGEFNVVNSGRSGEFTLRAYGRLGETVYPYQPRFVIVGFGTNDSLTNDDHTFNVPPEAFRYYLSRIIYDIKVKTGAIVLVLSTGVLDENLRNGHYNDDMEMYNQIAAEVAAQNGCVFIDVFHQMISDPTKYVDPDGLHFNKGANRIVAGSVFNALVSRLDAYGYPK